MNLLGETRREEKRRLLNEKHKAILSGKTSGQINQLSFLRGASGYQLKRRRNILEQSGIKHQKPMTIKERLAYL